MDFCGMKREIDRKCLNHARVHANASRLTAVESWEVFCKTDSACNLYLPSLTP